MYKRFITSTFLMALTLSVMSSCTAVSKHFGEVVSDPDSKIKVRTIALKGVDELKVSSGIVVRYEQNDSNVVVVSSPEDVAQYVKAEIEGDELKLSLTKNMDVRRNRINVTVKSNSIDDFSCSGGAVLKFVTEFSPAGRELSLSCSGGAIIESSDRIECDVIGLECSGGAVVKLSDIKSVSFACESSSGAVVNLGGVSSVASFDASSGTVIEAAGLKCEKGDIDVSSGAIVKSSISNASIKKSSGGIVNNSGK